MATPSLLLREQVCTSRANAARDSAIVCGRVCFITRSFDANTRHNKRIGYDSPAIFRDVLPVGMRRPTSWTECSDVAGMSRPATGVDIPHIFVSPQPYISPVPSSSCSRGRRGARISADLGKEEAREESRVRHCYQGPVGRPTVRVGLFICRDAGYREK